MTPEEVEALKTKFIEASCGQVTLLDKLPCRVRMSLHIASLSNSLGFWLVEHDHIKLARILWRI
jgi:hypothetical protein